MSSFLTQHNAYEINLYCWCSSNFFPFIFSNNQLSYSIQLYWIQLCNLRNCSGASFWFYWNFLMIYIVCICGSSVPASGKETAGIYIFLNPYSSVWIINIELASSAPFCGHAISLFSFILSFTCFSKVWNLVEYKSCLHLYKLLNILYIDIIWELPET